MSEHVEPPNEPREPPDAVEPTESAEPTEPVAAVEPTEPVAAVDPAESVEPTAPLAAVEPTEPVAAVEPREPVAAVEPVEATAASEPVVPPEPVGPVTDDTDAPAARRRWPDALKSKRVGIVVVLLVLVWLGVWAYSSGSSSTSSVGTAATLAATPTTQASKADAGHHRKAGGTTTLAPPPDIARTPQAYATALIGYMRLHDRKDALRVATLKAVNHLFARRPLPNEALTAHGCQVAGRVTNCTWSSPKRVIVLQVQNPIGSTPVRVVAATVTRT